LKFVDNIPEMYYNFALSKVDDFTQETCADYVITASFTNIIRRKKSRMKTRKLLALLIAAVLVAGLMAACGPADTPDNSPGTSASPSPSASASPSPSPSPSGGGQQPGQVETTPDEPDEPDEEPPANMNTKTPRDTLVVGTPAMNGDFINGFGNSSYDLSIKTLTGGYCDTYYQTPGGQIELNPTVVKNLTTSTDSAGNKTYTFEIHNDLKWNNGFGITAKDYVASVLLYASPEFSDVGVSSSMGDGLLGRKAYSGYEDEETEEWVDATTNVFAGVKLISDYVFSLTIDKEELPYFWESSYVAVGPIPLAIWLVGVPVVSTDEGASFGVTPARLATLCQQINETERNKPTVSCGPYKLVSFTGTVVTLQKNPHFKGDPFGNLPSFEWIVQMEVSSLTDVDMVLSGDLDLNTGNIEGRKIEAARASEYAVTHSYNRAGYGYIAFPCDWGPTADVNVRWAIAHMIDRNAIIDHVLGGYGGLVDAAFGAAQWTYQERRRELESQLIPIAFNLTLSNDFLDKSIWKFESDGTTPFDRTKANAEGTYMRHNSDGEMLTIRHLSASPSVGGAIESETIKNSPLVGIKYEVTNGDFNGLLQHYYYGYSLDDNDRIYNAFNLATNFSAVDDKYWSWHSTHVGTWLNAEQLADPELDRLTIEMRRLDGAETDKFADLWVQFQVRWQQLLPNLPLYSNEYFDIFNNVVKSVPTSPYANYQDVICEIHKWP